MRQKQEKKRTPRNGYSNDARPLIISITMVYGTYNYSYHVNNHGLMGIISRFRSVPFLWGVATKNAIDIYGYIWMI